MRKTTLEKMCNGHHSKDGIRTCEPGEKSSIMTSRSSSCLTSHSNDQSRRALLKHAPK